MKDSLSSFWGTGQLPIVVKNRDNPDFPLRRIVKCSKCGTPFTGAWSTGCTTRHAYYFCRNRCGAPSVKAYELDFTTAEYLRHISPTPECLDAFIALLRNSYYKRASILQKKKNSAEVVSSPQFTAQLIERYSGRFSNRTSSHIG